MVDYKKIKKGDLVKIIHGKDNGKSGKVIEVNRDKGKVLLEGLNFVKKTMRKSKKNQMGGIKDIEAFLNISNVMLVCPKCKKASRITIRKAENNKPKSRICKKCNNDI